MEIQINARKIGAFTKPDEIYASNPTALQAR